MWSYALVALTAFGASSNLCFKNQTSLTRFHKKGARKEYCIGHSTNNPWPWGSAHNNAGYLKRGGDRGSHVVIDDKERWQIADYSWSVSAVGGRPWRGFTPKPWLSGKVKNANSISWEMCFGWDRNNTEIVEKTAADMGFVLVTYGLEIGSVARHHDVSGKYCPFFGQLYMTPQEWVVFHKNPSGSGFWNQGAEDVMFWRFKLRVQYWQYYHLYRLGKITKAEYESKLSEPGMQKWVCGKNGQLKPWVWTEYPIKGIEREYKAPAVK